MFLNKFSEFERRVKIFFEDNNNNILQTDNCKNNDLVNNQQYQFNNEYPADLPSIREINNANYNYYNYNNNKQKKKEMNIHNYKLNK